MSNKRWLSLKAGASNWLWLAALVVVIDQWTKALVTEAMTLYESNEVLPILDLTLLHNTGAAFSMLHDAGGWQKWLFIGLAVAVSIVILVWLRRLPEKGQGLLASGLALILGGAIGNVVDRVNHGYVVDFIHFHYDKWYFPAFNVADSAITVGAALLIIDSLLQARREAKPVPADDGKPGN